MSDDVTSEATEDVAAKLPPTHGTVLPDGWYAWNDGWRDDRGMGCGGPETARFGFSGQLKQFCEAIGLSIGAPSDNTHAVPGRGLWRQVQGLWYAEIDLADVPRVIESLDKAKRPILAKALALLLPVWSVALEEERAEEYALDAIETQRIADGAATCGVSVELYKEAEGFTRALQRMASSKDRGDLDYFARCLPVVAQLLAHKIRPGMDKGHVVAWDGPGKGETLVRWKWIEGGGEQPDRIALLVGEGAGDVGDWRRTLPGAIDHVEGNARYTSFDGRQVLRVTRQLERRSLAAALAIRLAICTDSAAEPRRDLALLSAAGSFAEIADPDIRRWARAVERNVPLPPGLALREYQSIGVAFLAARGYRGLIADAMGLGKTIQAIATLLHGHGQLLPALIVAPGSVTHNWVDEIRLFAPWLDPVVIGSAAAELPAANDRRVWIVSWDLLAPLAQDLLFEGVQTVIGDEIHMAKNPQAKRSQAFAAIGQSVPYCIGLSGTVIENKTSEMWHPLHIIDPNEFPTRDDFNHRYRNLRQRVVEKQAKRGRTELRTFVDDAGGDLNAELRHRLRYHMVRRRKSEVLGELPDKTRIPLWFNLPDTVRKKYDDAAGKGAEYILGIAKERALRAAVAHFHQLVADGVLPAQAAVAAVRAGNSNSAFNQHASRNTIMSLWRFVGEAKVAPALQWIADRQAIEAGPLVVFVWHQAVLKGICAGLNKLKANWTYFDGSVSAKKRNERVKAFQAGERSVIVLTKAGYQGITLTAASDMLFVEQWWNPSWMEQAEDRIHRIGQENRTNFTHLLARGTVDEHITELLQRKRTEVEAVMGGERINEEAGTVEQAIALLEGDMTAAVSAAFAARIGGRMGHHLELDKNSRPILVTLRDLGAALKRAGSRG